MADTGNFGEKAKVRGWLARNPVFGLGVLFGLMYFAQGICEPTEGLLKQPVQSLLKSWGATTFVMGVFSFLLSQPWNIKPLYGLLTDFVPLLGTRRKGYLIVTSSVASLGLLAIFFRPPPAGAVWLLLAALVVPTIAIAFGDVVIDALMVEKGKPLGATGRLQSIQWASIYAADMLVGVIGGYLSEYHLQNVAFLICAVAAGVALPVTLLFVREPVRARPTGSAREVVRNLVSAFKTRSMLAVGAFIFLCMFNPFYLDVKNVHFTKSLHFSEAFYGTMLSLQAAGSLAGAASYGFYCRRVPFGMLIHLCIALGVASTLLYWLVEDEQSAAIISPIVGFTYMTALIVQLDLAAMVCPPIIAGTAFAAMMSLSNAGTSFSNMIGTWLYDVVSFLLRDSQQAYNLLVALGAACTACCWLLVPQLRRCHLMGSEESSN
ncbi:MAG: MFS transporter [Pirellulales bacterium]